jgi:hypothetical protein
MDPRTLLQLLMDRAGENPHSLSAKLNGKPGQPRIHDFVKGDTKEPRRSTLEPIARHYRIPIDALSDPRVAAAEARRLGLDSRHRVAEPAPPPYRVPPPPPPRDYSDRREVSSTDWATLQDVKLVLAEAELERIAKEAARIRRTAVEQIEAAQGKP